MAFVPFSGGVTTEIRGVMDNQRVCNVLGWNTLVPPDLTHLQQFAFQLANWWTVNAIPLLPNTYQFSEVYAYRLNVINGLTATNSLGSGTQGTRLGSALPNSNTLAFKLNSNQRGRGNTGRIMWCGLTEPDVINNVVGDPFADSVITALEDLRQQDPIAFPDTFMIWCVLSRYDNNAQRVTGVPLPITSISTTDRIIDSQRRRLPGRGK